MGRGEHNSLLTNLRNGTVSTNEEVLHQQDSVPAYRQSKRNKTDSIVSMTVNAQSLKLKKDDLQMKAKLHKPLLIGVTESWGNEKTEDAVFKLKNYIMYRSDRTGQRGGGGREERKGM